MIHRALPAVAPKRRWIVVALGLIVVAAAAILLMGQSPEPSTSPTPVSSALPRYDARGRIAPVHQARVSTLEGGVLRTLVHHPGDRVRNQDELARIDTASGSSEILLAPFDATVLAEPVQAGDTLLPGSTVALVGDLSQLQVQTIDVDEYLIGTLAPGQPVEVVVDALPNRTFSGRIAGITLSPETGSGGDLQYPVVVGLNTPDPALRPGMTARIHILHG